jgi:1-acyl-sn-glycerol-3-phosphate acyltransferase
MLRALVVVPLAFLWTALTCSLGALLALLTFRKLNDRLIEWVAWAWGAGLLAILGIRLRVVGRQNLRARHSRVVVMNHTSALDMMAMGAIAPPGMMALGKREFLYFPFLGLAWWALGQAFVDRSNKKRARRSIDALTDRMRRESRSVVIFPEGTRSRGGELQPFKMGAFHLVVNTHAPLVPMVIYNAWERVRPDSVIVNPGEITVVIHPERDTSDWTSDNLREKAAALHAEYERWVAEGPPASLAPR